MDLAFSLRDIHFLAAVRDIVTASDRPLHLLDLKRALLDRGISISHGAPRGKRKRKSGQPGNLKDDVSDLSRRLSRLEGMLGGNDGVQLILDISVQEIQLAPNAFDLINDLERSARQLRSRVERNAGNPRLRINVGLTNSVTAHLLPRVLMEVPELLAAFPNMDLKVVEGEPWQLGQWVRSEHVDFALAPENNGPAGVNLDELCEWPRVLLYNAKQAYEHDFSRFDESFGFDVLQDWLADETVLIPPRNVMSELEGGFLPPPRKGRRIKLPQASLRRNWVRFGLGVAISHGELVAKVDAEDPIRSIDLSNAIGTTRMCFYFRKDIKSLSDPAQAMVNAIRTVLLDGNAQETGVHSQVISRRPR